MGDKILNVIPGILGILLICSSYFIAKRIQARLNRGFPKGKAVWNLELDPLLEFIFKFKQIAYALLLLALIRHGWRHARPGSWKSWALYIAMCAGYAAALWFVIRYIDWKLNGRHSIDSTGLNETRK